jgi:DNA-binding FadR family transcriptional regulator
VYKVVQASRLYRLIVDQIEQAIRDGQLKPGDQLPPERDLAQRFAVSRTAVREAVKALCEKGLVEALPGRGTFVIDGTTQVVRQSLNLMVCRGQGEGLLHVMDLREILEPEIAARAAAPLDEKQLIAMREAVAAMEASEHVEVFLKADLDFHRAIADAAQNPLVSTLIESIVGILSPQLTRLFHAPGGLGRSQHHHRRILDGIERHDPIAARKAMRAYLQQVRDDARTGSRVREDSPLNQD